MVKGPPFVGYTPDRASISGSRVRGIPDLIGEDSIKKLTVNFNKSLTAKYEAEIHVLFVVEDIAHHDGWYGAFDGKHVKDLMEHANKTATKRLGQICDKYLEGCPLYIEHVAVGCSGKGDLEAGR